MRPFGEPLMRGIELLRVNGLEPGVVLIEGMALFWAFAALPAPMAANANPSSAPTLFRFMVTYPLTLRANLIVVILYPVSP
jgi:hypothetical protein